MPPHYEVSFSPAAERQLGKLPAKVRERVIAATERLEQNPRHAGVKKLAKQEEMYRVRVGITECCIKSRMRS